MGDNSAIEWTDATWNPVTGCTKVSPGCKNCYAERLALRLQAMGNPRYRDGFKLTLHPDQLTLPLRWKDPRRIFVNSMSDLFHEDVPEEFIGRAFDIMAQAHWHVFQVLTKRSKRLAELAPRLLWPSNIWQGVSVENARYTSRVADLLRVPAAVRFLSIEPLLGSIPQPPGAAGPPDSSASRTTCPGCGARTLAPRSSLSLRVRWPATRRGLRCCVHRRGTTAASRCTRTTPRRRWRANSPSPSRPA